MAVLVLVFAALLPGVFLGGVRPAASQTVAARGQAERDVFLLNGLSEEDLLTFTTAVAASGQRGVVLLDSPRSSRYTQAFLDEFRPSRLIPVGFSDVDAANLEERLSVRLGPPLSCDRSATCTLCKALFREAKSIVVCPAEPRRLLLQAACLGGATRSPLFVLHGKQDEASELRQAVTAWNVKTVVAVGAANRLSNNMPGVHVQRLSDEDAVFHAYLREQLKHGSVKTLVVANPADVRAGRGRMSTLAPWVALQHRAALLLTNDTGTNTEATVRSALQRKVLAGADTLILVADLQAIPMEQRPNPIPDGKDQAIEMEPMTPDGREPIRFATGRLFHEDRGVVTLMLARQGLLAAGGTLKALVASNPGGGLPLLETFSRNTASEMRNAGYETTPLIGEASTKDKLRLLLPEQNIFLWEGHHSTLVRDYGIHQWSEPLRPSLVFLQSCLALAEPKAQPFLQRGAVGVIASSSRTYSGSGGAFALAYFDALLYEDQSLGGALRSAKNFMLAFSQLKEKRLGARSHLGGANLRAAWSFTLWGDPTVKLPRPALPANALATVKHQVRGNQISLILPDATHDKVVTVKYQAEMRANARLAGLLTRKEAEDSHRLVPLVFAEIHLPGAPAGKVPRLHGRLPESRWVFCYDQNRHAGYLLVMPRERDSGALRFHVLWE
jgi:hypothetical protein